MVSHELVGGSKQAITCVRMEGDADFRNVQRLLFGTDRGPRSKAGADARINPVYAVHLFECGASKHPRRVGAIEGTVLPDGQFR